LLVDPVLLEADPFVLLLDRCTGADLAIPFADVRRDMGDLPAAVLTALDLATEVFECLDEEALDVMRLRAAGYALLPLGGGADGKAPLLRNRTDPGLTLGRVLAPMHRAGVQVYGVRLDGLAVVDCDTDDPQLVTQMEARFGASPVHVQTPRGLHLYFRAAGAVPNLRGEGLPVDIKTGARSYVAGPLSTRADGGFYAPVKGLLGVDRLPLLRAATGPLIHQATMMMARRLNHVETIPQQDVAERALNKLARTYASQNPVHPVLASTGAAPHNALRCQVSATCIQFGDLRFKHGNPCIARREGRGNICGLEPLRNMLGAVRIPGRHLEQDHLLGARLVAGGHEFGDQPVFPLDDYRRSPNLDPAPVGVVDQEQVGLGVVHEVSRGDELPVADIVNKAKRLRVDHLQEAGGTTPMLDIRLPFGVGGRQKHACLPFDERLEVERYFCAPAPRLFLIGIGTARTLAGLDVLYRRGEGDIAGKDTVHSILAIARDH